MLILNVYLEKLLKGPVRLFFFFFLLLYAGSDVLNLSLTGKTFEVVDVAF